MNKLESVILESLYKFKNKQINLHATATREMLAQVIADDIRQTIKKERRS